MARPIPPLLLMLAVICVGCASAEIEYGEPVSCVPSNRECSGNAAYRVCNMAGDGWELVPCTDGATCVLGVCEELSNSTVSDVGLADALTPAEDVSADGDPDLASDAADVSSDEDATRDTSPSDAPPEDTSPSNDTSVAQEVGPDAREDTTPGVDTAPDDPCAPNPCTEPRRTVCSPDAVNLFKCACDDGTVEVDDACVVPERCAPGSCNAGGACDDTSGAVSCDCDPGYIGERCAQCDAADGYHRGAQGACTDDPCDPNPCAAAGPCQDAGICDPGNGQCSYATSPLCEQASGSWRWTFSADSGDYVTLVALSVNSTTGAVEGTAIDPFGLAMISGWIDARDQSADLLKDYIAGFSTAGFLYLAAMDNPTRWSGAWMQEDAMSNAGTFIATRQSALAPSVAAGQWIFAAGFSDINVNLSVDPQGLVEGTMSDSVGSSTVFGVFDRGNGALRLRKLYSATEIDWWYVGTVSASGASISNGVWTANSNDGQEGAWTGRRP